MCTEIQTGFDICLTYYTPSTALRGVIQGQRARRSFDTQQKQPGHISGRQSLWFS